MYFFESCRVLRFFNKAKSSDCDSFDVRSLDGRSTCDSEILFDRCLNQFQWFSGKIGNNFVLWGCLSVSIGSVHFSTHSPVDEDPAKCVYRRQLICLSGAVDLTEKKGGAHAWIMGGRTRGSTDRRTPLLDNLLLTPVLPLHDELAIHHLLRSNSSSVANAVLFFTRNNIVTFLTFTNNDE
jgi:hypothetical protein